MSDDVNLVTKFIDIVKYQIEQEESVIKTLQVSVDRYHLAKDLLRMLNQIVDGWKEREEKK